MGKVGDKAKLPKRNARKASGEYKQKPILNAKFNKRCIAYARPALNAKANQRLKRMEQISYEEVMAFRIHKPSNTSLQLVFSAAALCPILAGPASQTCSQRAARRFYAAAIGNVPSDPVYI